METWAFLFFLCGARYHGALQYSINILRQVSINNGGDFVEKLSGKVSKIKGIGCAFLLIFHIIFMAMVNLCGAKAGGFLPKFYCGCVQA